MLILLFTILFAIMDLGISLLIISKYKKYKKLYILLMSLIGLGLFYDAFIVSLGGIFTQSAMESGFFKFLASLRYILHGGLIPLLFLICEEVLKPQNKIWFKIALCITILFSLLGIIQGCLTKLELVKIGVISRYTSSDLTKEWVKKTSRFVTITSVIPIIIVGIIIFIKRKIPYLFLGGISMFIFAALGGAISAFKKYNFFISMIGEILMILFYYIYVLKDQKEEEETDEQAKISI